MLWPPTDFAVGGAYLRDDFDVEGDLMAVAGWSYVIGERLRSPSRLLRVLAMVCALPSDRHFLPSATRAGAGRR